MALPTATTPGYALFRGEVACYCLRQWLPVLEQLAILKGYIRYNLDIIQLTGDADASAGVHSEGGAFDLFQTDLRIVALAREMGAPATWQRLWTDNYHTHGVLTGCPHNSPARYQVTAQRDGFNGLGYLGRKGPDPHPDPKVYRTWSQGLAWGKAEIARLTAITPIPVQEDNMPLNEVDKAVIRSIFKSELTALLATPALSESVLTRFAIVKDTRTGTPLSTTPRVTPSTLLEAAAKPVPVAPPVNLSGLVTDDDLISIHVQLDAIEDAVDALPKA